MSLSSLRSLSGAATFASVAFDTARSTLKAMADAATPPAAPANQEQDTAAEPAAEQPSPGKPKGVRLGTVLDAYA